MFEDAADVERALSAEPILLYGNHRLNVGQRKTRGAGDRERLGPGSFTMDREGSINKISMKRLKECIRPVQTMQ